MVHLHQHSVLVQDSFRGDNACADSEKDAQTGGSVAVTLASAFPPAHARRNPQTFLRTHSVCRLLAAHSARLLRRPSTAGPQQW